MKTYLSIILLFVSGLLVSAQEKSEEPSFGIKFSGFVKTDVFHDTRQTINIREGHFLLYPAAKVLDNNLDDINSASSFNILSIQSRLKGSISGPDAFGAQTSGAIEADFFGNAGDENGFRLRHAFTKLKWTNTELMVGQYWHPMFVTDVFPGVISFNTGAPFQPFSRNPQVRLTYKTGQIKLTGVLFSQRDFTSFGPNGASSIYLRNACIPNIHLQAAYKLDSTGNIYGAGVDYKILRPLLQTTGTSGVYASKTNIGSFSALAFVKLNLKPITIKAEGVFAQNAYDMLMLGGYAVESIIDPATGEQSYININTLSFWTDIDLDIYKNTKIALFVGYTKNLGAKHNTTGTFYNRGGNIDNILRIAPRVEFVSGKFTFAIEQEITVAYYGTTLSDGSVSNAKPGNNLRSLFSCIYKF